MSGLTTTGEGGGSLTAAAVTTGSDSLNTASLPVLIHGKMYPNFINHQIRPKINWNQIELATYPSRLVLAPYGDFWPRHACEARPFMNHAGLGIGVKTENKQTNVRYVLLPHG